MCEYLFLLMQYFAFLIIVNRRISNSSSLVLTPSEPHGWFNLRNALILGLVFLEKCVCV